MADEIKNASEDLGADISNTIPEKPKRKRTVKKSDDTPSLTEENTAVSSDADKNEEYLSAEKITKKRKTKKEPECNAAKADGNSAEEKPKSTAKRKPKLEKKPESNELQEKDSASADTAAEDKAPRKEHALDDTTGKATEVSNESYNAASESGQSTSDFVQEEQQGNKLPPLMNIEHFFDYRASSAAKENEEEATNNKESEGPNNTDAEKEADDEDSVLDISDDIPVIQEYENYTILDEIEDEAHEKEVRERIRKSRDNAKYDADKPRAVDKKFDMIELFVFTLVIIMILTTFVFKHSVVEGPSMMDTLQHGDHLIISDVFYKPKQYDIIVFQDFESGYTDPIVKRVIATEGQHVLVESMNTVYVDGKPVPNDFVRIDGEEIEYREDMYPMEWDVPEGEVYVMGDHRNASDDSRYFPCKSIKVDSILGKVLFRIYPFDGLGIIKYKPKDE